MTATERLYEHLTEHWSTRLVECENGQEIAQKNLARLSMIYSGQLHFEFDDEPEPPRIAA